MSNTNTHSVETTTTSSVNQTQENTIMNENQLKEQVTSVVGSTGDYLGEVVFLNLPSNRNKTNKHSEVLQALQDNDLPKEVARQFSSKQAFNRALQKLKKDGKIDQLREDKDEILFQLSKKFAKADLVEGGKEVEWKKNAKILLDRQLGKVYCKVDSLRDQAQALLDSALEDRTTSDVTSMVKRLLEDNVDCVPLATGSYFVRQEQVPYLDKVQKFLEQLGRNLQRLAIPKGNGQNDRTIMEGTFDYFDKLLEKLREKTKEISIGTRASSSATIAKERNAIRAKIDACKSILGERLEELGDQADSDDEDLRETLERVAEERKSAPPTVKGASNLFGFSLTKVLHYLGANGWSFEKAKKAVCALADTSSIKESSLRTFWSDGRNPKYSKPAELTTEQVAELEAAASAPETPAPEAPVPMSDVQTELPNGEPAGEPASQEVLAEGVVS